MLKQLKINNSFISNSLWIFLEKVFRIVPQFLVGIYVARYLGPQDFGTLMYVISFTALFGFLARFGIENLIIRELISNKELEENEILGSAFFIQILGAILSFGLIYLSASLLNEEKEIILYISILASTSFFTAFEVIDYFYKAKVKSKYNTFSYTITTLVIASIKLVLVYLGAPLIYFVLSYALEAVLVKVVLLFYYHKSGNRSFKWKINKEFTLQVLKLCWPLVISGAMVKVYGKIDQVFIKNMLSAADLGFYSVAVKLLDAWNFIPVAIASAFFPFIGKIKDDVEKNKKAFQLMYDIMAVISFSIFVVFLLFAKPIIGFLFSPEFLPSTRSLQILSISTFATFLGVASEQFLIMYNHTRIALFRTITGAIINVVLNIIMIPLYGIEGAAWATVASYFIAIIFSLSFFSSSRNHFLMMIKSFFIIPNIKRISYELSGFIYRK